MVLLAAFLFVVVVVVVVLFVIVVPPHTHTHPLSVTKIFVQSLPGLTLPFSADPQRHRIHSLTGGGFIVSAVPRLSPGWPGKSPPVSVTRFFTLRFL